MLSQPSKVIFTDLFIECDTQNVIGVAQSSFGTYTYEICNVSKASFDFKIVQNLMYANISDKEYILSLLDNRYLNKDLDSLTVWNVYSHTETLNSICCLLALTHRHTRLVYLKEATKKCVLPLSAKCIEFTPSDVSVTYVPSKYNPYMKGVNPLNFNKL